MRWGLPISLALAVSAGAAQAISPAPACDVIEADMQVHSHMMFGYDGSGFVIEQYQSVPGRAAPIPELENFNGFRVTDCRSGRMVAVDGVTYYNADKTLLATEFLRDKVKARRPIYIDDVRRAARALYANGRARVLDLMETDETCACRDIYPGRWE